MNRSSEFALCLLAAALGGCMHVVIDSRGLFAPEVQWPEIVGFVAGIGTSLAALPSLIIMMKRRSTAGANLTMTAIMSVSQMLWILYGLMIASRPIVLWNALAVAANVACICAYFSFDRTRR